MKKVILIVLCFVFILSGCSKPSQVEEELKAAGYTIENDSSNAYKMYKNSTIYVWFDETDAINLINIQVYPSSYQTVELIYSYSDETWKANYFNEYQEVPLNPNDAYAYIESLVPESINELNKLAEAENIDMTNLENGDKGAIEELIVQDVLISKVKVVDSSPTNISAEEMIDEDEHYVQVNFDFTNKSKESINMGELRFDICYTYITDVECQALTYVTKDDTFLLDKVLIPKETISIQQTAIVKKEAYNFYVKVSSEDNSVYGESNIVANSN